MAELEISNVVSISVSEAPTGVGSMNTSNLALFTREVPDEETFGSDGFKIYKSPTEVAEDFGTGSVTYQMANAVFSQQPNILANSGYLVVIPFLTGPAEDFSDAITRTEGLVQYFGIMSAEVYDVTDTLSAAAVVQAMNKIVFFVSIEDYEMDPGGRLDQLRTGSYTKSRGLYYGESDDDTEGLVMMAAYAGRALSTNFSGSNTTQTMHLKTLAGIQPDSSMTESFLTKARTAGVDTYPSIQGVPKVFCTGANSFFDQVYHLGWFVAALETAGFNYLAQASTKIPQTEDGMRGLKGAYRKVCQQAVVNQFCAPGEWTLPTTFGNLNDFLDNIRQVGYYIYSTPISQQLPADREDRIAPLIQIALKEAGAIHSTSVLVSINA